MFNLQQTNPFATKSRTGFQSTRVFDLPVFEETLPGFEKPRLFPVGPHRLPPPQPRIVVEPYLRPEIEDLPTNKLQEIDNAILVANVVQRNNLNSEEKQSLLIKIIKKKFGLSVDVQKVMRSIPVYEILKWLTVTAVGTAIFVAGSALIGGSLFGGPSSGGFVANFATGMAGQVIGNLTGNAMRWALSQTRLAKWHIIPFENVQNLVRDASKKGYLPDGIADAKIASVVSTLSSEASFALWTEYMQGGGLSALITRKGLEYVPLLVDKGIARTKTVFNNSVPMWDRLTKAGTKMAERAAELIHDTPPPDALPMSNAEILSDVSAVGMEVTEPLARVDPSFEEEYTPNYSFVAQQHVILETVSDTSNKTTIAAAAAITTTLVVGLYTGKLQNVALSAAQSSVFQNIVYQQLNRTIGITALAQKAVGMSVDGLKRIEYLNNKIPLVDAIKKQKYLKELFLILFGTYYAPSTLKSLNQKQLMQIASSLGMKDNLVKRANRQGLIQLIQARQDTMFNLTYENVLSAIISKGVNVTTAIVTKQIFEDMYSFTKSRLDDYRLNAINEEILKQLDNERLNTARSQALHDATEAAAARDRAIAAAYEAALKEQQLNEANQGVLDAIEQERFASTYDDIQNAANDVALAKIAEEAAAEALRVAGLNAANEEALNAVANERFIAAREAMLNAANDAVLKSIADQTRLNAEQKAQLEADLNALNEEVLKDLDNELMWKLVSGLKPSLQPPALAVNKLMEILQSPENAKFYEFDPLLEEFVKAKTIAYLTTAMPWVAAYEHAASYYNLGQDAARVSKAMANVFTTIQAAKEGFPSNWADKLRNLEPNADSTLASRLAQAKLPSVKTIIDQFITTSPKINLGNLVAKNIYTSVKEGIRPAVSDAINESLFGKGTIGSLTKQAVRGLMDLPSKTAAAQHALESLVDDAKKQLPN